MTSSDKVTVTYGEVTAEFPVIQAVDGPSAVDISKLTAITGLTAYDQGFVNTASTKSAITFIDANWTGIDKMKQWADKLGNQPSAA